MQLIDIKQNECKTMAEKRLESMFSALKMALAHGSDPTRLGG